MARNTLVIAFFVVACIALSYGSAIDVKCPASNLITTCTPNCKENTGCATGQICCPNVCSSTSCVDPKLYQGGTTPTNKSGLKSSSQTKTSTAAPTTKATCTTLKCGSNEKCEIDKQTKKEKCVKL